MSRINNNMRTLDEIIALKDGLTSQEYMAVLYTEKEVREVAVEYYIESQKSTCSHNNTEHQDIRCTVCLDCGTIVETDV